MNKIFIHKTVINKSCKIDAYLFQNEIKDTVLFGLEIPREKEDLIDSFIDLCNNDDDIHINIYNFIKNELLIIYGKDTSDNIRNQIRDLNNELTDVINRKDSVLSFNINMNEIVSAFNTLGINYFIKDNCLFKTNSTVKVPDVLCNYFNKAISEKNYNYLKSLDLFWTNCLLKKDISNIEDLFLFIYENGLTITPNGYLFCFRRILHKIGVNNEQLFQFAINMWRDCLIYGRDPAKVYIDKEDDQYYITNENSGELDTLQTVVQYYFNNTFKAPTFTDNHTKRFTYKVGGTYVVDNVDNNPNNTCSYGLHIGSKSYVYNNKWLGEQIVGCIVNPRDIIAVSDIYQKLRVRKMYIACLITEDELNDFNPAVYHFDYENTMIEDDNTEFATYLFNESYKKNEQFENTIIDLKEKIREFENDLLAFARNTNMDINEIKSLLKNNYVTKVYKTN